MYNSHPHIHWTSRAVFAYFHYMYICIYIHINIYVHHSLAKWKKPKKKKIVSTSWERQEWSSQRSAFMAIFLGLYIYGIYYLENREKRRKQAKIQGNLYTQNERSLHHYILDIKHYIKIVISYKISRVYSFSSFFFSRLACLLYPELKLSFLLQ